MKLRIVLVAAVCGSQACAYDSTDWELTIWNKTLDSLITVSVDGSVVTDDHVRETFDTATEWSTEANGLSVVTVTATTLGLEHAWVTGYRAESPFVQVAFWYDFDEARGHFTLYEQTLNGASKVE